MKVGFGLFALVTLSTMAHAGNWPSFQNGGKIAIEDAQIDAELAQKWLAAIPGYGQSSPIAWDGRIYVTSVSGDNKETYHVAAIQLSDGAKLWQKDFPNPTPAENNSYISKAAPTPVADANGIVCFFEGGVLAALAHSGDVRWQRNLVEEFGAIESRHGLGASLEQSDRAAFVWVERQADPYILAVDKQTGETIWNVPGLATTSWSTPRLIPVEGGQHLVLSGVGALTGLDPATGEKLWTLAGIKGNSTPTPIPVAEGRLLIGATVGRGEGTGGNAAESNGAVAISRQDDGTWKADYVWKAAHATCSFGSPAYHDGFAYFVNASGVLYCLDATTGEERYAQRSGGSIWATPVVLGSHLVLPSKDGVIRTIAAGDTFKLEGEHRVFPKPEGEEPPAKQANPFGSGPTVYAAIVVDNLLLVRTGDSLYSYELP